MNKGFFVVIVRHRDLKTKAGTKAVQCWKANLIEPLDGWPETRGESMEAVLNYQKEQYNAQSMAGQITPELVSIHGGPMATGQTVRFVAVR